MPTTDTIILDTMNVMQALHRTLTVDGRPVTAPPVANYPTVIDTPSLPFVMTWPAAGEAWQKGHGFDQWRRTFRVIVYLQVLGQDDVPSRTVPNALILQQIINLYVNPVNTPLGNIPPYQLTVQSGPDGPHITDGGLITTLSFGGRPFVGCDIQVPIRAQYILS